MPVPALIRCISPARTIDLLPREFLVLQLPFEHVSQDLDVTMYMAVEALAGLDAVLVDHAQRTVLLVHRIVVIGEREGVVRLEPAVIGITPIQAPAYFEHEAPLLL